MDEKREAIAREEQRLKTTWVNPAILSEEHAVRVLGKNVEREYSLYDLLRRPEVNYDALMSLPNSGERVAQAAVAQQVEIGAKYQGYITKQNQEVQQQAAQENLELPATLDYREVRALSIEAQQRLNLQKPETIGHASRISGITPADISLLLVHLKRGFRTSWAGNEDAK